MNRYRSAPPGRTPQPDVVHSQRGAFPAGPSSNPRPDVIGYQRGAYPTFASSPSTTTSHFQQAQHAASPYTAPPPNVAHLQHSQQSGSRYPAQVPSLRDVRHEFSPRPLPQSPPQPRALDTHYDHHAATPRPAPRPDPSEIQPSPHFIIVGLFALRLTLRLVSRLDTYPQRTADVRWLETFLAPYPAEYALAKVSGASKEEYVTRYPDIVGRMKCQPMYPVVFMGMNPDKSRQKTGEMTDLERLDIIDFCDAAGEWGSVVPIPAKEADRMIELAEQRRVADLEVSREGRYEWMAARDEECGYEVCS